MSWKNISFQIIEKNRPNSKTGPILQNLINFKNKFKEGKNIKKKDYISFCDEWINNMGDSWYYIKENWEGYF